MAGGQAKILSDADINRLLKIAKDSRHPIRNAAIVQFNVRAGLRASEIALLDWSMVTDGRGNVANVITLPGRDHEVWPGKTSSSAFTVEAAEF